MDDQGDEPSQIGLLGQGPKNRLAARHRIRVIDDDNTEVVTINGLTKGEARWMLSIIHQSHPNWCK